MNGVLTASRCLRSDDRGHRADSLTQAVLAGKHACAERMLERRAAIALSQLLSNGGAAPLSQGAITGTVAETSTSGVRRVTIG